MRFYLTILFFLFLVVGADSQSKLTISGLDELEGIDPGKYTDSDRAFTTEGLTTLVLSDLHEAGYLLAQLDSLRENTSSTSLYFDPGKAIRYTVITLDSSSMWTRELLHTIQGHEDAYMSERALSEFQNQVLSQLESEGKPFAKVSLTNSTVKSDSILLTLQIEAGKEISYGDIEMSGVKISESYIRNLIRIEQGDVFNKREVDQIKKRINSTGFLQMVSEPKLKFEYDKAVVSLDIQKSNRNRFDFLIGVLSNNSNAEQNYILALDILADLYNPLGQGEHIQLEFRRTRPETQELSVAFNYPYILQLPLGIDFAFDLYKNSNDFLDSDINIGWQYLLDGNNFIKVFWEVSSSRLINVDTSAILRSGVLPNRLDSRVSSGGVMIKYQQLDYLFNPRRGLDSKVKLSAGIRKILPNLNITSLAAPDVDYSSSFDSLKLSSSQIEVLADLKYYIPIGLRSTLLTRGHLGWNITKSTVLQNELYRMGGIQTYRGFDEETILADLYSILTMEFRLLLSRNSYFSVFSDYGWIRNPYREERWDSPFSIGGGLSFETKAGIFAISTAVGKEQGNPMNFRNAKVHFGYVSLF